MTLTVRDCGAMVEPGLGMSMDWLLTDANMADDLRFRYFFRSDRILQTDDRRGIDSPERWTSLDAVAAFTIRVKFGPMVSHTGFLNLALLAKMACTMHSFSPGRF
jgi:alkanesulfonate monooxygenase SsuD/methylene tetrahydromethanopterin reductase-like flavin-dependent oxidoreductase (luciferase family)